jgi:hypothetical protein
MAPPMRAKHKPKGGIAAAKKPKNPATVNPAAANDTAVATGSAAKHRHLGHDTPANATANNTMELDPAAAVTMHSATAKDADVPSGGEIVTTIGSSDSIDYGNLFVPLPPPPAAAKAPSLSFSFLDGKISTTNTMVVGEIISPTKHAANTTSGVETTMDTTTTAGGASAHILPTNSLQIDFNTPKKLNGVSSANTTVDHVITSPAMHATKTTSGVETTMDTATNADGATTNPLPPDSVALQKLNDISTNEQCPSDTNTHTVSTK